MKTQMSWIVSQLKKRGWISRNECLRRYISRLGARISDLKREGYQIVGEYKKTKFGMDYVYKLINRKL
jgi:hypothetical protein